MQNENVDANKNENVQELNECCLLSLLIEGLLWMLWL